MLSRICKIIQNITERKLEESIFAGPQIRKIMIYIYYAHASEIFP